mmetsp:Transcript_20379/g.50942  ORF Transcript_20379/g.50942 Transcript_20379/m.50942 type:complete len:242 (+) Transcript_20379:491-1216(+)
MEHVPGGINKVCCAREFIALATDGREWRSSTVPRHLLDDPGGQVRALRVREWLPTRIPTATERFLGHRQSHVHLPDLPCRCHGPCQLLHMLEHTLIIGLHLQQDFLGQLRQLRGSRRGQMFFAGRALLWQNAGQTPAVQQPRKNRDQLDRQVALTVALSLVLGFALQVFVEKPFAQQSRQHDVGRLCLKKVRDQICQTPGVAIVGQQTFPVEEVNGESGVIRDLRLQVCSFGSEEGRREHW